MMILMSVAQLVLEPDDRVWYLHSSRSGCKPDLIAISQRKLPGSNFLIRSE